MPYFSTNEVRDYLTSRGLTTTEATYIQTYAARMVAAFVPTGRNASLVNVFETVIRPLMPICAQTYGLGLNAAQVKEVIRVNFPDLYPIADTYKDVIVTDINTNLVGTPVATDSKSAKETYLAYTAAILTKVAKYMRHFAGLDNAGSPLGELFVNVPM